ncbi:unnamed protein product [Heterobilharzia americana]|nr:unnamed protein product [Heterobilharzia americana]
MATQVAGGLPKEKPKAVQVFGRKKTATAVAHCKLGSGSIRVNGRPLDVLEPRPLLPKLMEPILLLGKHGISNLDIRVRVSGGGRVAQIYAKYVDECSKNAIKEKFVQYDRSLLVADPRRCEPKKFGGPGARARYQKSYR